MILIEIVIALSLLSLISCCTVYQLPKASEWTIVSSECKNNTNEYYDQYYEILDVILELGFFNVSSCYIILPAYNLYSFSYRLDSFIQYIADYRKYHSNSNLFGYYTLYDGWREHTDPVKFPIFIHMSTLDLQQYGFPGQGTLQEGGRFIRRERSIGSDEEGSSVSLNINTKNFSKSYEINDDIFPRLNASVLTFSRHRNDPDALLYPDPDFISTDGHLSLRIAIDSASISWDKKINKVVGRGSNNGFAYPVYNSLNTNESCENY